MVQFLLVLGLVAGLSLPLRSAVNSGFNGQSPLVADVGLDPGHSSRDVGAVGGGLREYQLTLEIAERVKDLLEGEGLAVAMSRGDDRPLADLPAASRVEAVALEQQARIAAVGEARVYVSIHLNGHPNPALKGAEVYYNGDNHGPESIRLAETVQQRLVARVRDAGYWMQDRGVKEDLRAGKPYGHFFSLRGDMPSILVEAMFLTNDQDAAALAGEAVREAVARGIVDGIVSYLGAQDPDREVSHAAALESVPST